MDKRKPRRRPLNALHWVLGAAVLMLSAYGAIRYFVKPGVHEALRRQSHREAPARPAVRKAAAKPFAAAPQPAERVPRLAIVLDDWGYNHSTVERAIAIGRPLTLAVIPHLPNSRHVAERGHQAGLGIMLHMPMQPLSKSEPLEPETIMTETPEARIRLYLERALASVPHARGVNNHQGSAATRDARVMRAVLASLHARGLFFIDSAVTGQIKSPAIARELGMPFAKRDVFIDNVNKLDPIKEQLRVAVRTAKKKGSAIAIGHDRKATLTAIEQMVPEIEREGVRLVLAQELVK